MKKRFVKTVCTNYFDDAMRKIEEARSLGFVFDLKQLREECKLYKPSEPAVFEINLFLPTHDDYEEAAENAKYRANKTHE